MTSNIGARFLERRANLGFQSAGEATTNKKLEDLVLSEVKKLFNPEFLNRLDDIIVFNALTDDDLRRIIELMVKQMNQTLSQKDLTLTLDPEATAWIFKKTCGDRSYGARPLRRALQKFIEDPLSEALIQGEIRPPAVLEFVVQNDELSFRQVSDKLVAATPVSS